MIESGEAKIGDRVVCPDSAGEIVKIYNSDSVLIKLDGKGANGEDVFCSFDLSECSVEK